MYKRNVERAIISLYVTTAIALAGHELLLER
jgi:hypothetical protein